MTKHVSIDDLGPFIQATFDRMSPPADADALVILREQGMVEVMVMVACCDTECTLTVSYADGGTRRASISLAEYGTLRQCIQVEDLTQLGAVFDENMFDGESYLVKEVRSGAVTRALLGNPRTCGLSELSALADELDVFVDAAIVMVTQPKAGS